MTELAITETKMLSIFNVIQKNMRECNENTVVYKDMSANGYMTLRAIVVKNVGSVIEKQPDTIVGTYNDKVTLPQLVEDILYSGWKIKK